MSMPANEVRQEVRDREASYAVVHAVSEAVPDGYKRTEAGLLPEDWLIRPLGDIAVVGSGGTPSRDDAANWNGDIPWITTSLIDFNVISAAEQFLTAEGLKSSAAKLLPAGTLLLALYGQGKTRGKVAMLGFSAATNQACASISPCGEISREFLLHYLTSRYEEIRAASNGGSQDNLNGEIVKELPIAFPPLAEQVLLAEVLSDVDALLAKLDQLIAKKRDLKQAAMQQLLTGRIRLAGFNDQWREATYGELFNFLPTATNSRADLSDTLGDVHYVHYGDIHTRFHRHLDFGKVPVPKIDRARCKNADLLRNGDWIMVDASEDFDSIGKAVEVCGLEAGQMAVAGLHTFLLRERTEYFAPGFKGHLGCLESLHQDFLRVATGMKVFGVPKAALKDLGLPVPPLPEQTAIAAILSDMDAELAALEARRAKTRELKQGMMQALLTGRIRLI